MVVSSLNRKLLRDLLAMRGQAFAIAMVVAAGVAMYVMYLSNFESLRRDAARLLRAQRFADVFASLKRAPLRVAARFPRIPGVSARRDARGRERDARPASSTSRRPAGSSRSPPIDARPSTICSCGADDGSSAGRPDEVLASEGFVTAHGLQPGDTVPAIINGRLPPPAPSSAWRCRPSTSTAFGPASSCPTTGASASSGWSGEALAAAFDMEGGFNDVALALAPGASVDEVDRRLDRLLEPYGGLGAIPRALQLSHWTLENELTQLQSFGFLLPLIFLIVAAFILNVALTRALALQRPQIAALKALGYGNAALGWHYVKWALAHRRPRASSSASPRAAGWAARSASLYNQFFRFPVLLFRIPPGVVLGATMLTLAAAGAGAFSAVRRAVRVPPAEAMRPEAPARYRRTIARDAVRRSGGSASPDAWCCATSCAIRSARRPRSSASGSRWRF